jgi:RHS repeat-associated protein
VDKPPPRPLLACSGIRGVHTSTRALPPNRFPGQWFQSESGLHQNWMRDYDPTTGRYLQADPLGLVDGASEYGYVGGNPGTGVDPRDCLHSAMRKLHCGAVEYVVRDGTIQRRSGGRLH